MTTAAVPNLLGADLLLNRVLVRPGRPSVDVATGSSVWVRQRRLDARGLCALASKASRVAAVAHPLLAELMDFGVASDGGWTEVWAVEGGATAGGGGSGEANRIRSCADRVLAAAGCRLVPGCRLDVRCLSGRAVVVPDLDAIDGDAAVSASDRRATDALAGLAVTRRAHGEYEAIVETLETSVQPGPQTLTIAAAPGSGLTTLFRFVAVAARRLGWVPLSGTLLAVTRPDDDLMRVLLPLIQDRHVVVFQDLRRATPAEGARLGDTVARVLGALSAAGGRPHLLLTAMPEPRAAALTLAPWAPAALIGLARNVDVPDRVWEARCADAVRRSGGWPGRFVRRLFGSEGPSGPVAYPDHVTEALAVREGQPVTIGDGAAPAGRADPAIRRACRQASLARSLAERGRHADALRALQGASGALVRRGADREAARTSVALGRLLWRRGRLAQAAEALARAHEHALRARDTGGMIAGLILQGWVAMHDDRLPEAERVLLTAEAAARHAARESDCAAARVSLAVCYRWQERWADAARTLDGVAASASTGASDRVEAVAESPIVASRACDDSGCEGPLPVGSAAAVAGALRALVACGAGDVGAAARELHAHEDSRAGRRGGTEWFVEALALRVHGALGDVDAIGRSFRRGLAAARAAREPLGGLELRVAHAEALADAGDWRRLATARTRLARWQRARIPALQRRRIDGLSRRDAGARSAPAARPSLAHPEALRVLAACREHLDEGHLIGELCDVARRSLDAHAVEIVAAAEGVPQRLGRSGAAAPAGRAGMLTRVFDAELPIGPERTALGVETAVPIRYGGLTIGAVYARWTALGRPDPAAVRSVLAAVALASAPAVRTRLDGAREQAQAAVADDLAGHSDAIETIREQVRRAAATPFPVLIAGESGTGKELVARALHRSSPRRTRRFCAINCAAVGDDLFEAELFGHARGAFTGAVAERQGLFEEADGGTLLLDEVGELSARAQAKLLRAIQEGEIRRVGENVDRRVDVRIVAATNRSLADEAAEGRFRQDLLFRLDVVRIVIPPLRERPEDVAELAAAIWRQAAGRIGSRAVLAPTTIHALARYQWPGNVRELQNVLSAVAVRAPRRGALGPSWLPPHLREGRPGEPACQGTLAQARRRFDERYVRTVLARHGGQRAKTALALGVTRQGLGKLIDRLGIE